MSICQMKPVRLFMAILLMLLSPAAFALGLGNIKVESYLNQPLSARIDLLVRPGEDVATVTARLASAEDYALIGASRDAIAVPLRFTVDRQTDQPFVQVTSNLPVNQPVLRLIIELNWPSGRLLREYTLFLDPPTVPAAAPPPIIDERRKSVAPAIVQPGAQAEVIAPESADEDAAADSESSSGGELVSDSAGDSSRQFSGEDEFGPVQSGDTLWRIASDWSAGSGASVNQVMLAIQRNNPQAFINNNINLLKRGAILRMPSSSDIDAIPVATARGEVLEQWQLFSGNAEASVPNPQTAARAVETPLVDVASEMSSAASTDSNFNDVARLEIIPPSEESAADSAYGAEDSVENSSASTSVVALQEELARKEEALITEQQTNEYLKQRIEELESRLAGSDSDQLLVEDEELADMESRLRDQRLAADTVEETPVQQTVAAATNVQAGTTAGASTQPWYSRWTTWVIGLLVLLATGFGWYRSRNGGEELELSAAVTREQTVRGIKDEAEEILKALKPEAKSADGDHGSEAEIEALSDNETSPEDLQEVAPRYSQARHVDHEEAYVLDEDSADPEVRLDLARAYISMGDREAARAILGEVIEHGNNAQQAEAKTMLGGL